MVLNINIALGEIVSISNSIRQRNNSLIDLYIGNYPVPTAVAAFEPGLRTLDARLKSLQKVHFAHCQQLFDDPDSYAAFHVAAIVDQLLNAINGFKQIFEQHYEPNLVQLGPYEPLADALRQIRHALEELKGIRQANPQRPRAEYYAAERIPAPHALIHSSYPVLSRHNFCPSATLLLNTVDRGKISSVLKDELTSDNRQTLHEKGGTYLWWCCPGLLNNQGQCAFRLRFHVQDSTQCQIQNTAEIRSHEGIPLQYRSLFLIESHLHDRSGISPNSHSTSSRTRGSSSSSSTYLSSFSSASRRAKYGCLFCYAEGHELILGQTAFPTGKELARHICASHNANKAPPAMVLEKLKVMMAGRLPMGVRAWDINFLNA